MMQVNKIQYLENISIYVFGIICDITTSICKCLLGYCKVIGESCSRCVRASWEDLLDIMASAPLLHSGSPEEGEEPEHVTRSEGLRRLMKWIIVTFINFMWWRCCYCGLRRMLKCCCRKQPAIVKVSILEADERKPVTGELIEMYSNRVKFSIDDLDNAVYRKVLIVLHYKHVQRGMTSYSQAGGPSPLAFLEKFSKDKSGADVLILYAGLPQKFSCWPWNLCACPSNVLDNAYISQLIERRRFLTLAGNNRLNPKQDARFLQWTKEILLCRLSVVGFSTKTRESVVRMLIDQVGSVQPITDIDARHLAKDDDFKPSELREKVLTLCSYTERDNIMVERPDVGELTGVYEIVEQQNVDVIVMYAGVIPDKAHLSANDLFAPDLTRLLKSQPKLRGLMEEQRFMTVSNSYKLNKSQKKRLIEWLTPSETL